MKVDLNTQCYYPINIDNNRREIKQNIRSKEDIVDIRYFNDNTHSLRTSCNKIAQISFQDGKIHASVIEKDGTTKQIKNENLSSHLRDIKSFKEFYSLKDSFPIVKNGSDGEMGLEVRLKLLGGMKKGNDKFDKYFTTGTNWDFSNKESTKKFDASSNMDNFSTKKINPVTGNLNLNNNTSLSITPNLNPKNPGFNIGFSWQG